MEQLTILAYSKSIEQNRAYHLVINPDISFDDSILSTIEKFMHNNSKNWTFNA